MLKSKEYLFKIFITVCLCFLALEIFLRSDFFWNANFRNSHNSSHEAEKVKFAEIGNWNKKIWIFGSSWGEYGVNEHVLADSSKMSSAQFSIISSQSFEQYTFYSFLHKKYHTAPEYVVAITDYTHIPIKAQMPTVHIIADSATVYEAEGISSNWFNSLISSAFSTAKYNQDLEIYIRHLFAPSNTDYLPTGVSIREAHIKNWLLAKKWFEEESVDGMKRIFKDEEIDNYLKLLAQIFKDTHVIIVEGPLTKYADTNFPQLMSEKSKQYPNISYLDVRQGPKLERLKHFYDKDHLNNEGAIIFSKWLDEMLLF